MFKKNNIIHIIILAIGFFWCSALYLSEQLYFLKFFDKNFVNSIALLYGSIAMAIGILIYIIIYKYNKNTKLFYILFSFFSIISAFVFFIVKNKIIMSIAFCLTCIFSTAGYGVGYHFSLISSNIEKQYRGRVFTIGYGLGSILTYLLSLFTINLYSSIKIMILYIPLIIFNIILVIKNKEIVKNNESTFNINYKRYFIVLSIITLLMSLLSAISTDVISTYIFNMDELFINTRIYYCLGLILAGFLIDKNREIFDICTISSFVFCLLSIILLNQNISPSLVISISYFLIGFFVVFRTITFINLSSKNMIYLSAAGLMYSRIMEGLFVIFQKDLANNYLLLIIIESIMLCLVLFVYLLYYLKINNKSTNDKVKELSIKYNLTGQEEKVLNLLIQDYTKKEIANQLFLSVNTIKIYVTNIYKKTSMNKLELKEKCS